MRMILQGQPEQTATLQFLAEENRARALYRRRKDGTFPPPYQFKLRTLHYPQFEFIAPDRVRYVGAES
jgi:hypothetical protein